MSDIYQTPGGANTPLTQLDRESAEVISGGSSIAALCGLIALVFSILGLNGVMTFMTSVVAVLAASVSLIFEGGVIAARIQQVRFSVATVDRDKGEAATDIGISVELIGGIAALVLGILVVMHIAVFTLLSIAVMVLGGAILLGSAGMYEVIQVPSQDTSQQWRTNQRVAASATGIDIMIGNAAFILGLLGVLGVGGDPMMLILTALLIVGLAEFITDTSVAARMTTIFQRR